MDAALSVILPPFGFHRKAKPLLLQIGGVVTHDRGRFCAKSLIFSVDGTHLSLIFARTHDNRTPYAGARSSGRLNELLFQGCQRPVFDRLGRRQYSEEITAQRFVRGSAELFRSHDVCHVIFGLDTTFADEALVDARTLLSCDAGVRKYARYLALSDDQAGSQSDFQRARVS